MIGARLTRLTAMRGKKCMRANIMKVSYHASHFIVVGNSEESDQDRVRSSIEDLLHYWAHTKSEVDN